MNKRTVPLLLGLLLLLATLGTYWPVLHHGFINFDDADYVSENPQVLNGLSWRGVVWAFTAVCSANWHPLTWLSHMLDVQCFGPNAGAHHLVSVLFHAANSLLLFWLLRRLTGAVGRSACVAALFALHPLHVESVAWVAERKDVLSAFFFLLTLLAYAKYTARGEGQGAKDEKPKGQSLRSKASGAGHAPRWYALALLLFALGLMSKPMLVTLPFVLLLLDFWPLGRFIPLSTFSFKRLLPLFWEKVPFLALAATSSVVTFLAQHNAGAMSTLEAVPLGQRISNALVSYVRYLGKCFWPVDLAAYYPPVKAWPLWAIAGAVALLGVITLLVLWQARRRPFLLVGWFCFLGMLVPVIGLVQVGSQAMADRYTYLPSIGVFLLVVWGGAEVLAALTKSGRAAVVVGAVAVVLCALLTRVQVGYWADSETLFAHALAVTGESYMTHFCLGNALIGKDRLPEGIAHLERAAQLNPSFPFIHGKLAYVASGQRKFGEAVQLYHRALACWPNLPEALNNLAWLLATCPDASIRNGPEAVTLAERACTRTHYQKTLFIGTLAAAYAEAGRFNDAVATAQKAHDQALLWGEESLARRNLELMEVYRAGKPWHEP